MTQTIGEKSDSGLYIESPWRIKRQQSCMKFNNIVIVALLVIGSLGLAGVLPGTAVGGTAVGLSTALFLSSLAGGTAPKNARGKREGRGFKILFDCVLSIALLTISALVLQGSLNPWVLGISIVSVLSFWLIFRITRCVTRALDTDQAFN